MTVKRLTLYLTFKVLEIMVLYQNKDIRAWGKSKGERQMYRFGFIHFKFPVNVLLLHENEVSLEILSSYERIRGYK